MERLKGWQLWVWKLCTGSINTLFDLLMCTILKCFLAEALSFSLVPTGIILEKFLADQLLFWDRLGVLTIVFGAYSMAHWKRSIIIQNHYFEGPWCFLIDKRKNPWTLWVQEFVLEAYEIVWSLILWFLMVFFYFLIRCWIYVNTSRYHTDV